MPIHSTSLVKWVDSIKGKNYQAHLIKNRYLECTIKRIEFVH